MAYKREDIEKIVKRITYSVGHNNYRLELNENRQKNFDFVNKYGLSKNEIESILCGLNVEDYSETVQNVKPGFESERLHIFGTTKKLIPEGDELENNVVIYIKINIIERTIDDLR